MSKLEVGDLFVVVSSYCCGAADITIGWVRTAEELTFHNGTCKFCRAIVESPGVITDARHYGWPLACVRKIEPLPKEDEVLSEEKTPC